MSFGEARLHWLTLVAAFGVLGGDWLDAPRTTHHARAATARRVVVAHIVDTTRIFTSDSVYELQGTVVVGPGATLVIEAGTRIEGDPATRGALVVGIGGNLIARGTPLEPIVFTCSAAVKTPGCWGGIAMAGLSPLNNGVITGGNVECPVKGHAAIPGDYGGCLQQDSSGVLRYVRIEYAGMAPSGGSPVPALALLGVGSGTLVESIQIHAAAGAGVFVSGGYVNLRGIAVTAPGADGLSWNDGWHGRAQSLYVQLENGAAGGVGVRGWNMDAGATMIGQRSDPVLSQVTVVGSASSAAGILLENGTAAEIANTIVVGVGGPGLDIQGAESCDQANGAGTPSINVHHDIFFGSNPDYSSDADCVDEDAYANAPARANRLVDPALVAGTSTVTPDLRPAPGSPAQSGFTFMPPNGFFDTSLEYVGAAQPVSSTGGGNIPWYAGWTRGWTGQP
jgi:hypothetical protein